MGTVRPIVRLAAFALAVLLLAACASKPSTKVSVGIGTDAYVDEDAPAYAALYLPYAQMAALAYSGENFVDKSGGSGTLCPRTDLLLDAGLAATPTQAGDNKRAAAWAQKLRSEWRCLFGQIGIDDCPKGMKCLGGLALQVWRRNDCKEAVIAFRGSESRDLGDWVSNLRWFVVSRYFDQYDQVRRDINAILKKIAQSGCVPPRIIATGHSLGGGLAQHAAYADGRINYVYAFDPSPVTGILDVPWDTRAKTIERFGTDRVYESGEILSPVRYIASGIFPSSSCRPRVRIVRFSTVPEGSLVERHKIAKFIEGMTELSRAYQKKAPLPVAYADATSCDLALSASGL